MAGFLYKGILLQQLKEPAFSRELREFFNADTLGATMDRKPPANFDELTHDDLLSIPRQARIVDERDGRLLADKLAAARHRKPQVLVADAIDDEPYISSQLNPLLQNQQLCAEGLRLAQRACGAQEAFFAVYKNLTDLEVKIPKKIEEFGVQRIRGRYPAEYQASKTFAANASTLMIGVGALIFLARAVYFNKPQTTAFITVAGDCVGNPTNLEISLGMTIAQTLERCGLIHDPARVVIGGSMTGISVIDTERTVVTPVTRAVLAFRDKAKEYDFQCIGCSRCVHVCPEGLNPYLLYRSARLKRYQDFRKLDAQMCIGCNTCSYMCPAKLDLCETIRESAQEFRRMTGFMRAASVAQKKREKDAFDLYMDSYYARKAEKAAEKASRREETAAKRAEKQALKESMRIPAEAEPAQDPETESTQAFGEAETVMAGVSANLPEAVADGAEAAFEIAQTGGADDRPECSEETAGEQNSESAEEPDTGEAAEDLVEPESQGGLESLLKKADEAIAQLVEEKGPDLGLEELTVLSQAEEPAPAEEEPAAERDGLHGWHKNDTDNHGGDAK